MTSELTPNFSLRLTVISPRFPLAIEIPFVLFGDALLLTQRKRALLLGPTLGRYWFAWRGYFRGEGGHGHDARTVRSGIVEDVRIVGDDGECVPSMVATDQAEDTIIRFFPVAREEDTDTGRRIGVPFHLFLSSIEHDVEPMDVPPPCLMLPTVHKQRSPGRLETLIQRASELGDRVDDVVAIEYENFHRRHQRTPSSAPGPSSSYKLQSASTVHGQQSTEEPGCE